MTPTVLAVAMLVTNGCDGGNAHGLWNDAIPTHGDSSDGGPTAPLPHRPSANASFEGLVQASGDTQKGPGGLIVNSAIIGEPIAVGLQSSVGAVSVRHGFTLPIPPSWPSGIAQAKSAAPANPHRD